MGSYLLLNLIFMAVVTTVMSRTGLRWPHPHRLAVVLLPLAVLMFLTLVFDNLIIYLQIVTYSSLRISGVRLGLAPIEDFAYSLLAFLLIPALWQVFVRRQGSRSHENS